MLSGTGANFHSKRCFFLIWKNKRCNEKHIIELNFYLIIGLFHEICQVSPKRCIKQEQLKTAKNGSVPDEKKFVQYSDSHTYIF
jgi:hypothetical protein